MDTKEIDVIKINQKSFISMTYYGYELITCCIEL